MDDTTQSRVSDAAAAATKKRRSSILKSQRAVRTPFSELEFNVTTPTDTTKSRRVSFSKRTGVAEFATNEATTTWKNFYEEHNRSLESSGNDSANVPKQIGHIGKRLFDQQFQEVEADLIGNLNPGFNYNSSITNVNFGQLTIVENTADVKLSNSQTNFEFSNVTNTQSKVFGDDLTMPQMRENSQPIDVNFSAINPIEGDDLDDIQKDLQNNPNLIHHGPFDRQHLSEYIEVDLNSIHVTVQNIESNMSITDTIKSPKVQEVSKSVSIEKISSKDWVTDKENIAVNPYVTPKESTNFAINEEPEKVLVFDGKKLTLQPDIPEAIINCPEPTNVPQRKTIVLNVHDDLPNFIVDPQSSTLGYISVADLKPNTEIDSDMSINKPMSKADQSQNQKTIVFDDVGDISFTQAIPSNIVQEKRRTIVYEDETGNISITQAVPTNIIEKTDKRTILYEDKTGNLTITQSIPTEKRKTIVYENEDADISMTQAISPNIIEKQIVIADDSGNLSITQAISNVLIQNRQEKKQTIICEDQIGRLSVTQSRSGADSETKIERRQTVVFENETGNISVTQVVPGNIILPSNSNQNSNISVTQSLPTNMAKRRTIVFDDADISMTQAVPCKIMSDINTKEKLQKRSTIVFDYENADMSVTQAVNRNTLPAFKDDEVIEKKTAFDNADVSVTQVKDYNILSGFGNENNVPTEKRTTSLYNADISTTQAINGDIIPVSDTETDKVAPAEKRHTVFDNVDISITQAVNSDMLSAFKDKNDLPTEKKTVIDDADISMTQAINADILLALETDEVALAEKRQTVFDDVDMSTTQAVNNNLLSAFINENGIHTEKRTTVFDNADISMTKAINADILSVDTNKVGSAEKKQTIFNDVDISITQAVNIDMMSTFNNENDIHTEKRTTVFDNADISVTQAINADILPASETGKEPPAERKQTVINDVDISITQAVNNDMFSAFNYENNIPTDKRTTIFDNADISMTQVIKADILPVLDTNKVSLAEKKQTVLNDVGIPITQTENNDMPSACNNENHIPTDNRTTVFDNADISMTQVIKPDTQLVLDTNKVAPAEKKQTDFNDVDISITQAENYDMPSAYKNENDIPTEKRTTVFDDAHISVTQTINSDLPTTLNVEDAVTTKKRRTVFDDVDISITQALNSDMLSELKSKIVDPIEKRIVFGKTDISLTQAVKSQELPPLYTENYCPTEKRQKVFDDAAISIAQTIDRDMLPAFNKEKARPLIEEKELKDNGDIAVTQSVENNQTMERDNVLKLLENNQKPTINNDDVNGRRSIIKEDINEIQPISDTLEITKVSHKKSIAFEDQIVLIDDIPSSQLENDNLDISMNDINTNNRVDFVPMTSNNISNIQIKSIQPTNEILVYQLASSSGQIHKGTEKGDANGQPFVNPSSMDVDEKLPSTTKFSDDKNSDELLKMKDVDEKLPSTTKFSDDKNSDELLKMKVGHIVENNDERKLSVTSSNDEMSTKSIANDINSKSDTVSYKIETKCSSSSNILSKCSSEMGKETVTLFKKKEDAQSLTVSQSSHGISDQNLRVDSAPKLTSRLPSTFVIKSDSRDSKLIPKNKDSLLKNLLDMSKSSYDDIEEPKPIIELLKNSEISSETQDVESSDGQPQSNDRLFFITRDDEEMKNDQKFTPTMSDDISKDSSKKNLLSSLEDYEMKKQLQNKPLLSLDYKEDNPIIEELQQKLTLLQTVYLDSNLPEKPKDTRQSQNHEDENAILKDMKLSKCSNKFRLANDTKELLDMLSDLTDKESPHKSMLDPHLEEVEEKPEPVVVKGHIALENKTKTEAAVEPRRISFLPQRKSIVLSREDLLNNISMASAALQKSRLELNDESIDESTITESPEQNTLKRRAVRMSDDLVKTLKFDEDSINQTMNSGSNMTPLRKTAFGESTYMTDSKCKVIPSFLKDVSSEVKELMHDLVKPMTDSLPYEATDSNINTKKVASTCNIKIQANLNTSSQIDIHPELASKSVSSININQDSFRNMRDDNVERSVIRALKYPIRSMTITSPGSSKIMDVDQPRCHDRSDQKAVLIFDHYNPLNNISLASPAVGTVHKYNPSPQNKVTKYDLGQSEDLSESASEKSASVQISLPPDSGSEIIQMNVLNQNSTYRNAMQKYHIKTESNDSKAALKDQFANPRMENKDINTLIAMKKNKELLETSSSLTLVDEPLHGGTFWSNLEDNDRAQRQISDIKLIYTENKSKKLVDSDVTSDESSEKQISKKRAYSQSQRDQHIPTLSSSELTPKPMSKMKRISETPPDFNQNSKAENEDHRKNIGTTVIVHQVVAKYDIQNQSPCIRNNTESIPKTRSSSLNSELKEDHSPEMVSSFTSSNNLREDRSVVTLPGWQDPEPDVPYYISESQPNIVTKLDMLAFMGSHECEWESYTRELWSFRLLHTCLRLTVRLQHSCSGPERTFVRADTPVLDVLLEILYEGKKNSVAVLCVQFAAEAMRYEISSGCRIANDVPSLLKRCARVARAAARWARAMQDLKARLAYSLTNDGLISLKVANIQLRSVWDIRFKVDMVVSESGAPFPQASAVEAARVLTASALQLRELKQQLKDVPRDWGHAPRSLWKVFKYLKYKRDLDS